MALTAGTLLGVFEIRAHIGAGAMGEVWRATDTNLGRQVAIKVLPDAFAQDPDRLARFEREAKILASLNHPNIAGIYGLEKADGIRALVMELVEGPTLGDRIAQGPMAIDEAIPVAKQIAEALEAAHEQGIIHRDLKPANIKLRPDGTVKVLDFGLSKVMEPAATTSAGVSESPTVMFPLQTMSGVILGTAAYMSPEQARGKPVDKRADVWAFGCSLYEMITGLRAFEGASVTETLAAVLHKEPDWSRLPASTPASIRRLLTRALRKDPASRLRDIADARYELQDAQDGGPGETGSPSSATRRHELRRLVAAATLGVLLAASAAIVMWPSEPALVTRAILGWRSGTEPAIGEMFALSDDGSRFAYVGPDRRLWVRDLVDLEARDLAGTEEARLPFFSPDGESVAFVTASGALKVVPVQGGSVRTLIPRDVAGDSGDWAPDGMIYFSRPAEGVSKIASTGGAVEPVSRPDAVGVVHTRVHVLPNGKGALVTVNTESANTAEIGVLDFATGKVETLFRGVQARFAASGHLVYVTSNGTLHAAPFDQHQLRVTGSAVPLIENVSVALYNTGSPLAISDTGTLLYQSQRPPQSELVWVSIDGKETPHATDTWSGQFFSLSLSPDATHVAVTLTTGTRQDVWTRSLETGAMNRLTLDRDGSLNYRPKWTPEGRAMTYLSNRSGVAGELWRQPADGSSPAERLVSDGPIVDEGFISPDGRWIVYRAGGSELQGRDIKGVPIGNGEDRAPQSLVATESEEYSPTLSPDGRWLAYVSEESKRPEVYVRPFPDTQAAVWQVSSGGGRGPIWARNGRQLFYQSGRNEMVAVQTRPGAMFAWDPPRVLFDVSRYDLNPHHPNYDVTPEGDRFLMVRRVGDPQTELVLTLNWHQELKRLVPTK